MGEEWKESSHSNTPNGEGQWRPPLIRNTASMVAQRSPIPAIPSIHPHLTGSHRGSPLPVFVKTQREVRSFPRYRVVFDLARSIPCQHRSSSPSLPSPCPWCVCRFVWSLSSSPNPTTSSQATKATQCVTLRHSTNTGTGIFMPAFGSASWRITRTRTRPRDPRSLLFLALFVSFDIRRHRRNRRWERLER